MQISVGIMTSEKTDYRLEGNYSEKRLPDGVIFEPASVDDFFELRNVTIGIGFHWQRMESQRFRGALKIVNEGQRQRAINILDIEDYLASVISSEMSSTSDLELLKAHAIISRSWAANAIMNRKEHQSATTSTEDLQCSNPRIIRYYERDAHKCFDVCADDHCQRYQGITRICSDNVKQAIDATRDQVLAYNGKIADARFYKCCGGATEPFENVWAPEPHPYLTAQSDNKNRQPLPDLSNETEARKWIMGFPAAFCNTQDRKILSQVLNNYDQETPDFYRWSVHYSQQELSDLAARKSGINFGTITDLIPVRRGPSGRLIELKIKGTERQITVGKELEIRKWLSPTHLYSSAFVIDRDADNGFILHGAGWGHGVGLCQIGAAMMAHQGYNYKQILQHYFPHTTIEKLSSL